MRSDIIEKLQALRLEIARANSSFHHKTPMVIV
jgi:hypothetical protein